MIYFLRIAFTASLLTLFWAVLLESIFPSMISAVVSVDILLKIAIFIGIVWAVLYWHTQYFQAKISHTT